MLENPIGELSLANDRDKTRRLQFLDLMGQRGGAHRLTGPHIRARDDSLTFADLSQNLIAPWIGQGLRNPSVLWLKLSSAACSLKALRAFIEVLSYGRTTEKKTCK